MYRLDKGNSDLATYPAGFPDSAEAFPLLTPLENDSYLQNRSVAFFDMPGYGVRSGMLAGGAKLEREDQCRFLTWPVTISDAFRPSPTEPVQMNRKADIHGRFRWYVATKSECTLKNKNLKTKANLNFVLSSPEVWGAPEPEGFLYERYRDGIMTYSIRPPAEGFDSELFQTSNSATTSSAAMITSQLSQIKRFLPGPPALLSSVIGSS